MTNFQSQYKGKTFGFGNTTQGRTIRAEKHEESRKNQRAKTFNQNRNITDSTGNTPQSKDVKPDTSKEDRMRKLMKWKAERERRRKVDIAKKKPPFKVGVVHHKIYSPANKDAAPAQPAVHEKVIKQEQPVPDVTKRITRATQKRLMAKTMAVKKPPLNKGTHTNNKIVQKEVESFAPSDHKFKAPSGLPQMPLFGNAVIRASTNRISGFVLSPLKTNRLSKRRSFAPFSIENISPKKDIIKQENITMTEEKPLNHSYRDLQEPNKTADSSIEAVTLKMSSEEEDSQGSSGEDKSNEKSVPINTSYTKSPRNNNDKLNSSSGSDKLNSSADLEKLDSPPALFSPYIVTSRGKSNVRKEQQMRRGMGHTSNDDIPTKDTVMQNLNISIEEEERTAQYFHFILNKEIKRLNELCDKWGEIQEEPEITEDGKYQINQAIGQTNLLINKKFERFRGLVSDCETGKGEMLVTCKDLQGFWDMMYMEVKDCDSRFEKLEKLRSDNWQEEQPDVVNPVAVKKKAIKKKKVVANKQSSLRALILAARQKKLTENGENVEGSQSLREKILLSTKDTDLEKPKVELKQISRKSKSMGPNDRKPTTPKTKSTRMSLLQKVQLSNASKKISSPLAIMKISQMCKTPEVHLDDSISYVNSDQTPGKSILKRSSESVSRIKSSHKVNFNDTVVLNEVPIDEQTKIKMDLSAALMRIESYDFDHPPDEEIRAERKLNFEDDSCDENETQAVQEQQESKDQDSTSNNQSNLDIPYIKVEAATPLSSSPKIQRNLITKSVVVSLVDVMAISPLKSPEDAKSRKTQDEPKLNETFESVRILRNRTVASVDTPRSKRRSVKVAVNAEESEQKENKSPRKLNRKSSLRRSVKKEQAEDTTLEDAVEKMNLHDNKDKRRKSARRSVKFVTEEQVEKECMGCGPSKPVLPMTPHIRRSKSRRGESRKSVITEDLISWETPEKPPPRVSRLHAKKQQ